MARGARHAQVIVVTHLPQVASWAQRQYVVSKGTDGEGRTGTSVREHLPQVASWAQRQYVVSKGTDGEGRTGTSVREVQGSARVEQIERMLAGVTTRTSLEHARDRLDASSLDNDNTDAAAGGRAHDD